MANGIMSPYDPSQPVPGTQQTGNQPTTAAPPVNTSSTVGNVPISLAPSAAGMPAQQQQAAPGGTVTPVADNQRQWSSTYTARPEAQATGAVTQGVAREATAAGQMDTLLSQESPYMKAARAYAGRDMNARGLMNSSLAVAASQEAAIKSALPIAQQDASTFLSQAQTNQNWQNKFVEDQNAYLRNLDVIGANTRAQSALSYQDLMQDVSKIDAQSRAERDKISATLSADIRKQYLDQSSRLYDQYMQQYSQIQQSSLSDAQKSAAITELGVQFQANRNWVNSAYANMSMNQIDLDAFKSMVGGSQLTGTVPSGQGGSTTQQPTGQATGSGSTATQQQVTQADGKTVVPPNMLNPITGTNGGTVPGRDDKYWASASPAMQAWNLVNSFGVSQSTVKLAQEKGVPLYSSAGRLVGVSQKRIGGGGRGGGGSRIEYTGIYG